MVKNIVKFEKITINQLIKLQLKITFNNQRKISFYKFMTKKILLLAIGDN